MGPANVQMRSGAPFGPITGSLQLPIMPIVLCVDGYAPLVVLCSRRRGPLDDDRSSAFRPRGQASTDRRSRPLNLLTDPCVFGLFNLRSPTVSLSPTPPCRMLQTGVLQLRKRTQRPPHGAVLLMPGIVLRKKMVLRKTHSRIPMALQRTSVPQRTSARVLAAAGRLRP